MQNTEASLCQFKTSCKGCGLAAYDQDHSVLGFVGQRGSILSEPK